jgi:hypothetical protein
MSVNLLRVRLSGTTQALPLAHFEGQHCQDLRLFARPIVERLMIG